MKSQRKQRIGFENCKAQPLEQQGLGGINAQDSFLSLDLFYKIIINIWTIDLVFVLGIHFYKITCHV